MYMHDECVGSRGDFAKSRRDPTHSSCIQSMKAKSIKGFKQAGGQAIFYLKLGSCSYLERILFAHLGRTLFSVGGGGSGQPLLGQFMLVFLLLERLDHKKLGNFSKIPHKMKRAIAGFTLATACTLAKIHHLRVKTMQALPVKHLQSVSDQKPDHE